MVRGARGGRAVKEADDEAAACVDEQNRKRKGESVLDERQQPSAAPRRRSRRIRRREPVKALRCSLLCALNVIFGNMPCKKAAFVRRPSALRFFYSFAARLFRAPRSRRARFRLRRRNVRAAARLSRRRGASSPFCGFCVAARRGRARLFRGRPHRFSRAKPNIWRRAIFASGDIVRKAFIPACASGAFSSSMWFCTQYIEKSRNSSSDSVESRVSGLSRRSETGDSMNFCAKSQRSSLVAARRREELFEVFALYLLERFFRERGGVPARFEVVFVAEF